MFVSILIHLSNFLLGIPHTFVIHQPVSYIANPISTVHAVEMRESEGMEISLSLTVKSFVSVKNRRITTSMNKFGSDNFQKTDGDSA